MHAWVILIRPILLFWSLSQPHTFSGKQIIYFGSTKIDDCNDDDGSGKEGGGEKDVKGWAELGHPQFYSDEQALLPLLNTRPPPPYIPPYAQIYTQVPLSITRGMR